MSPWIIETPPEYSVLFLTSNQPFRNSYRSFSRIVDSDTYQNNVNIPLYTQLYQPDEKTRTCQFHKALLYCQVIPFRREEWDRLITVTALDQKDD